MEQITLKFPFKNAAGQLIDMLEIKRLKRADMKAAQKHHKDAAEQEDYLLAKMSGLTVEDIDQLDLADSKQLLDSFRGMVGID